MMFKMYFTVFVLESIAIRERALKMLSASSGKDYLQCNIGIQTLVLQNPK